VNAKQEVVDGSKGGATSPTVTSSVRPKLTLTAPSVKPLFGSNTRAIVWGMQTRAVQVNNNFHILFLFIF
jgi:hypothetical protein